MRTYIAYSTENYELCGITVLALADAAALAEAEGRKMLPGGSDMRADTWRKNFCVQSESALRRRIGRAAVDVAIDIYLAETPEKDDFSRILSEEAGL